MNSRNPRILRTCRIGVALAAALGLVSAAPAWAAKPVDETRSAAPDATIRIESLSGQVRVVGWSRNEVRVTGTVGDDVERLKIEGQGGRIEIDVELPDERRRTSGANRDYSVDLEISVPTGSEVNLESVSTSTEVRGFAGLIHSESVSGAFDLEGDPAEVKAETVSGSVRVHGSPRIVRAESVSGEIAIDGSSTQVAAETVSGSVQVTAQVVESLSLGSVSGAIAFEGGLARGARLEVEGHSGTIDLLFNPDVSARFEVETFSGEIDNRLSSETARRTSRYAPGKELEFTVGSGDAAVSVESFSGQVTLRSR